jgi:hypothetical protein
MGNVLYLIENLTVFFMTFSSPPKLISNLFPNQSNLPTRGGKWAVLEKILTSSDFI